MRIHSLSDDEAHAEFVALPFAENNGEGEVRHGGSRTLRSIMHRSGPS